MALPCIFILECCVYKVQRDILMVCHKIALKKYQMILIQAYTFIHTIPLNLSTKYIHGTVHGSLKFHGSILLVFCDCPHNFSFDERIIFHEFNCNITKNVFEPFSYPTIMVYLQLRCHWVYGVHGFHKAICVNQVCMRFFHDGILIYLKVATLLNLWKDCIKDARKCRLEEFCTEHGSIPRCKPYCIGQEAADVQLNHVLAQCNVSIFLNNWIFQDAATRERLETAAIVMQKWFCGGKVDKSVGVYTSMENHRMEGFAHFKWDAERSLGNMPETHKHLAPLFCSIYNVSSFYVSLCNKHGMFPMDPSTLCLGLCRWFESICSEYLCTIFGTR